VALVTPASSPGVSDDPSVAGVSNSGHGVIDLTTGEAVSSIVDTASVGLEGASVGFNVDGNWTILGNSLLKSSDVSWGDVGISSGLEGRADLSARAIFSSVWVVALGGDTVAGSIIEGVL